MDRQRNRTLELIKLFASYMVVFIHVMFNGQVGSVIDTLARFAVPLFFLISGYYSYQITTQKIIKRIKKILILFIVASICYTLYNIIMLLFKGSINDIVPYFRQYLNFNLLINLFVFNVPISAEHLWYLLAIIYVYIIYYFATAFRFDEKMIFIVSGLLLFTHLLLGEGLSIFGIRVAIKTVRNFALMGIPFFSMGLLVKKHEKRICNTSNFVVVVAILIGIALSIFSRYCFGKNDLYIGSLFILFGIVTIFVKYSAVKYPSFVNTLTGCSTYIYIYHIIMSSVVNVAYRLLRINIDSLIILKNIHPITVCIASTIFAYCVTQILNFLCAKKNKKEKTVKTLA